MVDFSNIIYIFLERVAPQWNVVIFLKNGHLRLTVMMVFTQKNNLKEKL